MASIRKRRWRSKGADHEAWVVDYLDQAGDRRLKTFDTKKEAEAWKTTALFEVQQGMHTPDSASLTIAQAGDLWIAQCKADALERSTVRQYQNHLDLHLRPFIGNVKLSQLTAPSVKDFANRLRQEGRSPAMVKKALTSLGALITEAQAAGRINRNVVRDLSRQQKGRRKSEKRHQKKLQAGRDFPDKGEVQAILRVAAGRWRPLIVTAIFTGLRASELRGLTWQDVDLKAGVLTVRQRADRWNQIGSPKSESGARDVPLPPIVVNTLREWKLKCPKGDLGLVLPTGDGKVQDLGNIFNRGFGPLQIECGVAVERIGDDGKPIIGEDGKPTMRAKYGMHAMRHFYASWLIEQGFNPKKIRTLLGHSSIQVTFDTYGHLFPNLENDRAKLAAGQFALMDESDKAATQAS